jgi:hypothetical protein
MDALVWALTWLFYEFTPLPAGETIDDIDLAIYKSRRRR